METYTALRRLASDYGLLVRGGVHPVDPEDAGTRLSNGGSPGTIVLLGNAGPDMWRVFARSSEAASAASHAMDIWTRRVIDGVAETLGAEAVYPFGGPPYLPFMRWAQRAEPVVPSPIGMLIHPDYGLWHAYRGALLFAERLALPPPDDRPAPCETCETRPCLTTCPVDAFTDNGYDVPACRAHISRPAGRDCIDLGCRARRACPAGTGYHYEPEQAEWHMRAFAGIQRGSTTEDE